MIDLEHFKDLYLIRIIHINTKWEVQKNQGLSKIMTN
jgi:hypothetical protein